MKSRRPKQKSSFAGSDYMQSILAGVRRIREEATAKAQLPAAKEIKP